MGKNNVELLSPTKDVVFQVLFGEQGSEEITKAFLEAILNEKITNVDLSKNPVLRRMKPKDKMGILDVLVKFNNNEYCNIEMQVTKKKEVIERALFYWSKTYSRNIKEGEEYSNLGRTIIVLIADFELETLKDLGYCTKWKIIEEEKRKIILTEDLEIVIIELPKIFKQKVQENGKLLDWLYFLKNPNSEKVGEIMGKNEDIKRAEEKLEKISQDEIMQKIMDWREDAERDDRAKERKIEKLGKELENKDKEIQKIIQNLIKKGMTKEEIEKITGIHKDEIQKIMKSND